MAVEDVLGHQEGHREDHRDTEGLAGDTPGPIHIYQHMVITDFTTATTTKTNNRDIGIKIHRVAAGEDMVQALRKAALVM